MSTRIGLVKSQTVVVAATPTVLVDWTQLGGTVKGETFDAARFDFFNDDPLDSVTIDIETSADGVTPDSTYHWQFVLAAGEHRSFPVPNEQTSRLVHLYWFASAQKNAVGTANVRVALDGYRAR